MAPLTVRWCRTLPMRTPSPRCGTQSHEKHLFTKFLGLGSGIPIPSVTHTCVHARHDIHFTRRKQPLNNQRALRNTTVFSWRCNPCSCPDIPVRPVRVNLPTWFLPTWFLFSRERRQYLDPRLMKDISLSLYIYIYIHICMYIYI